MKAFRASLLVAPLLLTACPIPGFGAFGNTKECTWDTTRVSWSEPFQGASGEDVAAVWEGSTTFTAAGLPDVHADSLEETTIPAGWLESWTLTLERQGKPELRSDPFCGGEHLAVPFSWHVSLANGEVQSWGTDGLDSYGVEGQVTVRGSREEDWELHFNVWGGSTDTTLAGPAFENAFGLDADDFTPRVGMHGVGDAGTLRLDTHIHMEDVGGTDFDAVGAGRIAEVGGFVSEPTNP